MWSHADKQKPATEEEKNEKQGKAFDSLRTRLDPEIDARLRQAGEEGVTDEFLRRWLTARKGNVQHAARDIEKHSEWAVELKPEGYIPLDRIQVDLDQNKLFIQGITKATGRPLSFVIAVRHIPLKPAATLQSYVAWALDTGILYGNVTLGKEWDGKIDMVFDVTGFGYNNFDLAVLPTVFSTLQDHYVERLGIMYICHAPFIFWGMWKLVRPFIDPVTREKIKFVTKETAVVDLGPMLDLLPSQVGGKALLCPIEEVLKEVQSMQASGWTPAAEATFQSGGADEEDKVQNIITVTERFMSMGNGKDGTVMEENMQTRISIMS